MRVYPHSSPKFDAAKIERLVQIVTRMEQVPARDPHFAQDPKAEQDEIRQLSEFLRELYGENALIRARQIEKRLAGRAYAPLVRITIEWLEREESRASTDPAPDPPTLGR